MHIALLLANSFRSYLFTYLMAGKHTRKITFFGELHKLRIEREISTFFFLRHTSKSFSSNQSCKHPDLVSSRTNLANCFFVFFFPFSIFFSHLPEVAFHLWRWEMYSAALEMWYLCRLCGRFGRNRLWWVEFGGFCSVGGPLMGDVIITGIVWCYWLTD